MVKIQKKLARRNTDEMFIEKLSNIFTICRDLLTEDGSLWIVIGDTRRRVWKTYDTTQTCSEISRKEAIL